MSDDNPFKIAAARERARREEERRYSSAGRTPTPARSGPEKTPTRKERPPVASEPAPAPKRPEAPPASAATERQALEWVTGVTREARRFSEDSRNRVMRNILSRRDPMSDQELKEVAQKLCISSERWKYLSGPLFIAKALIVVGALWLSYRLGGSIFDHNAGTALKNLGIHGGIALGAGTINAFLSGILSHKRLESKKKQDERMELNFVWTLVVLTLGMLFVPPVVTIASGALSLVGTIRDFIGALWK